MSFPKKIFFLIILSFIIIIPIIGLAGHAANDPGHDSLYVLKLGDNVTGNINITGNLTATLVEAKGWFFGPNIVVRGDGSASTAVNRVVGDATDLTLDSTGIVYLKRTTGGQVIVGAAGTPATLNVSGNIYQQNQLVCLANGTNCPGSLGSANISGTGSANTIPIWSSTTQLGNSIISQNSGLVTIAGNLSVVNISTTGNISGYNIYSNGNQVCTAANGLCGSSGYISNSSGWVNTTTVTYTMLKVGIGTTAPVTKLDVNGSANFTNGNVSIQTNFSLCFNAACTARMYHNGTALIIEGQ